MRLVPKSNFEVQKTFEALYTGGPQVLVSFDEQLLITAVGEDVLITDMTTGKRRFKLQGVRYYPNIQLSVIGFRKYNQYGDTKISKRR